MVDTTLNMQALFCNLDRDVGEAFQAETEASVNRSETEVFEGVVASACRTKNDTSLLQTLLMGV
jgi:hypothetical protein